MCSQSSPDWRVTHSVQYALRVSFVILSWDRQTGNRYTYPLKKRLLFSDGPIDPDSV